MSAVLTELPVMVDIAEEEDTEVAEDCGEPERRRYSV